MIPGPFDQSPYSMANPPPWEQKGRGLAVFNCPAGFTFPAIEHLPDSLIISDITSPPDLMDTAPRIILKLSLQDLHHLNKLMNTIVLPAFHRYIPFYLFASFETDRLTARAIPMPDRQEVDRTVEALWPEQLRVLLACLCVVSGSPEAITSSNTNLYTPFERYLFNGFYMAKIPFEPHAVIGPYQVDGLVTDLEGKRFAVEVDGRHFIHERQQARDAHLIQIYGLSSVMRFSGSELLYDRSGCINRIRDRMKSGAQTHVVRVPEPVPALSEEQGACMMPLGGPMLTLAPAGSGKTRVLTRRVVESVHGGINPARILCVVFNKAASLVMSTRIHDEAGLLDVHIRTLHSLGYEICRQAPESPYKGYEVVTDRTLAGGMLSLYRQALKQDFQLQHHTLPRPFPEHLILAYEEAVSRHRRTLIPINDPALGKNATGYDPEQLERVYRSVHRTLCKKQLMTYDDQLYNAVKVLLTVPCARRFYQHRFDALLVDEVQDLTPVQFFLLRLLALPQNHLFAVGDDDQMINTFTGADPANIRSFQTWYPGASIRTLGENYRCAPDIVQQSAHVISYNQERFEKSIRPAKVDVTHQEAVRIITCPSLTAESAALVHTIRQWIGTDYKYADIAVLVRVKSIAGLVQMVLKEHSIPFLPLENAVLYTSPIGQTIGAYLDICRQPEQASPASYAAALSAPTRYLTNSHLRLVAKHGHRFLQNKAPFPVYIRAALKEFHTSIRHMHRRYQSARMSATAYFDEMIDRFGMAEYFIRKDQLSRHPLASTSQDILEIIRRTADEYADPLQFTDAYFQRQADEQTSTPTASEDRENQVTITTIHRSKGDEYRGVILFHAAEQTLPHRRMIGTPEDIEEERRVFYVAVTRAVDRLCITTERGCESRFLAELKTPYKEKKIHSVREWSPVWRIIKKVRGMVRRGHTS